MDLLGQTRTPRLDLRAEVQQLVGPRGGEAGDPPGVVNRYVRPDLWIRDLVRPSTKHCCPRKGVRVLGKDVGKPANGSLLLHVEQRFQIGGCR